MSSVSFVRVKKGETKKAIEDSLDLIEFKLSESTRNIVIKPNMCYYWDYTTGQTTDPKFVAALIDLIHETTSSDPDISVVESDASAMKCKYAFKMLGYEKLTQENNVKLVNLSEDKSDAVEVKVGGQTLRLKVPRTIQEADLKINIPKIKYMHREQAKITCALKNIYGCNPYPRKFRYHSRLQETIIAVNKAMKFDLCLVDGIIVSGVHPRKLGLVMASKDPVATDAAAARIAGTNPKTIRYLQLAAEEGLGKTEFKQLGMPLKYFEARYPSKAVQRKLMEKIHGLVVTMGFGKRLGLA